MIEIVVLVLLTIHMGKVALRKGLKPGTWRLYTVLSWICGEIVGVVVGLFIFAQDNIISLMLMGIGGALGGYFIVKSALDKKPDSIDDDINRIGVDDLRP